MIISKDYITGELEISDDGCGCCSRDLDLQIDKDDILKEIQSTIGYFKDVIEYYGMDWKDFLKVNNLES